MSLHARRQPVRSAHLARQQHAVPRDGGCARRGVALGGGGLGALMAAAVELKHRIAPTAATAPAAVTLHNLTVAYNRHPAIHHISGVFREGSLTALCGPNGGGKSSLL